MKLKYLTIFLIFGLLISSMSAFAQSEEKAVVSGKVYDLFLEELNSAVITINSEPKQTIVSKDGTYSFSLSPGTYIIRATYYSEEDIYEAEETLEVKEPGNYVLDLILIPSLDSDDLDSDEFEIPEQKENTAYIIWLFVIALLIVLAYIFMKKKRPHHAQNETSIKSESEEDLEKIIAFLKESGNRSTQKEIRKKFPSSEAKVSLMLTELESKGVIKRIKKGRSNVILLEKRE